MCVCVCVYAVDTLLLYSRAFLRPAPVGVLANGVYPRAITDLNNILSPFVGAQYITI